MKPRFPLWPAALAALMLPGAAQAAVDWGQPSTGWEIVTFRDVNGLDMKLWHNDNVGGELYELEPVGKDEFQAKKTGYLWEAGPQPDPQYVPPYGAPSYLGGETAGLVGRSDCDYKAPATASPFRDAFNLHRLFSGPSKTVRFPTEGSALQATPFCVLKGPVYPSPAEKAAAKDAGAQPSVDDCLKKGGSASQVITCSFTPLELALGNGRTLSNGEGQPVSIMPAADDPVVTAYGNGNGERVKSYVAMERKALAAAAAAQVAKLDKLSQSPGFRAGFDAGEDALIIKLAAGTLGEDAFFKEVRESAEAGTLADFVKKWRGQLRSTLAQYAQLQGEKVAAIPAVVQRQDPPPAKQGPPPARKAPAKTGPPTALTPGQLKAIDSL